MGLRFRKSVSICKGVKLNFGKTGMSVSIGTKGYHKTINTNGRVTTSIGIPGTGIYYTDTKKIGENNNRSQQGFSSESSNSYKGKERLSKTDSSLQSYDDLTSMNSIFENSENQYVDIPEAKRSVDIPDIETTPSNTDNREFAELIDFSSDDIPWNYEDLNISKQVEDDEKKSHRPIFLTKEEMRDIYKYCDPVIEWTEILSGADADELLMNKGTWNYCKNIAPEILKGNIDFYLQAIETLRPVDDLLLYCGDFEFGTDKSNYLEVEFVNKVDGLTNDGINTEYFKELISAISIRVARDLFALLPINKVIVHVVDNDMTIMSGIYDRSTLNRCFKMEISDLIRQFRYSLNIEDGKMMEVERIRV